MMGVTTGEKIGNAILVGGGTALALGGVAAHTVGAVMAADAAKKQLELDLGYRAHQSEVFTELVEKAKGMKGKIPRAAIENRGMVNSLLGASRSLSFYSASQFERLLSLYLDVLRRITHPYVVSDQAIKSSIIDALEEFNERFEPYTTFYPSIMTLFVKALSNRYLTDKSDSSDASLRDHWYKSILEVSDILFKNCIEKRNFEVEIDALRGKYLWLPEKNVIKDKGAVVFDALGEKDVFVCFAQSDYKVGDHDDNNIYEIVIGAWENKKIEIRVRSLGKAAAEISCKNTELDGKFLNPRRYRTFWVSLNKGLIQIGQGKDVGNNVLLSWQDPFPWKKINYIGIGSWLEPIRIKNVVLPWKKKKIKSVDDLFNLIDAARSDNKAIVPKRLKKTKD
jgi:hypothetical protein